MDNEPENTPKKPARKKKKSSSKTETSSIGKINKEEVRKMLAKVIMQDMMDREMHATKDLEIDSLVSVNQEFMKCFMIIGYDLNETPVVVFQANSQLQADALSSAITKLVINGGKLDSNN